MTDRSPELKLEQLDLGVLSYLVGLSFNHRVTETLLAQGHTGVRQGLGFVIQHLIAQPQTATALAQLMGVSQQAAAKSVKELLQLGYVEDSPASDGRSRVVQLSEAGWDLISATRRLRTEVGSEILAGLNKKDIAAAHRVLLQCLDRLGGTDAVRGRRVQQESL